MNMIRHLLAALCLSLAAAAPASFAQVSVGIGIADSNVSAGRNQIQIDISGGDNSPNDGASSLSRVRRISRELNGVLAAVLLDLK